MTSREPNATLKRLACALRYDRSRDSAPRVMTKGWGRFAERIIAEARKAGVPLREDTVLVRLLAAIDIAEEIPEELFRPVAELVVAVYRAATARGAAG